MKNIEIRTTQNVVLEYELAGLRERVLAWLIDIVCLWVGIFILAVAGIGAFHELSVALTILLYCVFLFYSFAMEVFNNGQSVGKMAMKIQVIKASGGQARLAEYSARWVFRSVDIYLSLGGIASVLVASSAKAQRIGDIVANTAVIKVQPKMNMNLDDLLELHNSSSYVPRYIAVKHLPERDMLLIKSTIDRHTKYQNDAHNEAVHLLAERIKLVLGTNTYEEDEKHFLQTVLKDYVMLTR